MKKKNNIFIKFLFDKLYKLGVLNNKEKEDSSFDLLTDILEKKKEKEKELTNLNDFQIELDIFHKLLNSIDDNKFSRESFKSVYDTIKKKNTN